MSYTVGVLIYDGVDLQEIATPISLLSQARRPNRSESPLFSINTVARTKELVTMFGGVKVLPDHIYPDAKIYDVILVPGGPGYQEALKVLRLMDWIHRAAKLAEIVAAVNTGIYLLAASRLLGGQTVAAVPGFKDAYPDVAVDDGLQLVVSGKIFTTSSHLHGQTLSLAFVAELEGEAAANYLKDIITV
jgi:transcriptional regulator GlxA family with amidase domain